MLTWNEIQNMSDEEVRAANEKLGKRALMQFSLLFIAKWATIVGAAYFVKRSIESLQKEMRSESE